MYQRLNSCLARVNLQGVKEFRFKFRQFHRRY